MEDLTLAEKVERAYDLAISALLGDSTYNFGELVKETAFVLFTIS